jgi:HlyD family secretion protein
MQRRIASVMHPTKPSRSTCKPSPNACRSRSGLSVGLLGMVIVVMSLACCATKEASEEVPTVTVQVGAAENRPINREVRGEAILYPRDQAAIVARVNAPVSKFYVDKGSPVRAGQVLAELENKDLTSSLNENQAGVEQAEAALQTAAQKAAQDLNLAREQLDQAQKVFNNRESLLKQGALAVKDVEDARISLTTSQNTYETAQKQYDLRVAEAQLTAAKAKTSGAEAQLSYTKIVSPINGVVTDRPVYAGEMPAAGSPILTVMDLSQVIARAHVSQQEAALLKAGDTASISIAGSAAVAGKVSLVSPALDPNSTTVEIWVQAANPGMQLRPGANASVTMVAETVPHAIVIPAEALLTASDSVTSVIVLDPDNKPHKQHVTVGIRNGDDVQIIKGLKGGDRVVTVGAFELASEDDSVLQKTKIQVQAPKMPDEDEDEEQ